VNGDKRQESGACRQQRGVPAIRSHLIRDHSVHYGGQPDGKSF